jgi:glycerol uptake facilitator protein
MQRRGRSAYAAELIGTFLLVLFIALVVTVNSDGGLGYTDVAVVGLLQAFVLMMVTATIGGTSGAHVNPAITLALTALRRIAPADAAIYIVMQVAGAVLAVLVVKLLIQDGSADAVNLGAPAVSENFLDGGAGAGLLGEALGTFALMWAYMGVAVNPAAARESAPLVIGATLGLAVMTVGPFTGAGLNPARAFGPALVGNAFGGAGSFLLVYVAAPVVGALLAGVGYRLVALEPPVAAPVPEMVQEPFAA